MMVNPGMRVASGCVHSQLPQTSLRPKSRQACVFQHLDYRTEFIQ